MNYCIVVMVPDSRKERVNKCQPRMISQHWQRIECALQLTIFTNKIYVKMFSNTPNVDEIKTWE